MATSIFRVQRFSCAKCSLILLCGVSFLPVATSAANCLLQLPSSVVSSGVIASDPPPEVHHDGIRVLQPIDQGDLEQCTSGSGPLQDANHAMPSLVESPSSAATRKAVTEGLQEGGLQRRAFICDAGCSADEPELEVSLSPWADWRQNSSGVDMIDSLVGFCKSQRESKDPFIMTVLWKGDVYMKACDSRALDSVGLYLIGPEDLSLALVLLLGVQRVAPLPAGPLAFGMYLSDYTSLLDHHLIGPGLPIFTYVGRKTSWTIPWPSSFTLISTQDTESWQKNEDQTHLQKAWEGRDSRAYWIGSVTGPWDFLLDDAITSVPRVKILKLAHEHPQQLLGEWSSTAGYGISWVKGDDKVSGFNPPDSRSHSIEELTGVGKAKYKDVTQWQDFKYYVNLDGVVLGGRFNKLLSLGGVVLQHQAGYREHISALAKPYEHYVPIEYDLSDLVEKIQWLQQNDGEAKRIAANGKALADKRMRFEDHVCYIWRALEGLSVKTASSPVHHEEDVALRLKDFTRVQPHETGMRDTMEAFWGKKLEDVSTGERRMTRRGIKLLEWAWDRMNGIYNKERSRL